MKFQNVHENVLQGYGTLPIWHCENFGNMFKVVCTNSKGDSKLIHFSMLSCFVYFTFYFSRFFTSSGATHLNLEVQMWNSIIYPQIVIFSLISCLMPNF